ncbi:hypothetical protein Tco_0204041 [Tanacetum coccineum]
MLVKKSWKKWLVHGLLEAIGNNLRRWLASKFSNHMTMDWYTKNTLWLYWTRGDDEEVSTDDELSDLKEEKLSEEKEIAKIFRIEMDIFDFETPLCKELKEFNHFLQIDVDVEERPWLDDGTWNEPNDICHECKSFQFKSGHIEWPTCNSNENGYCNGGNLPGMIQVGNMTYFKNYEWYEALEDGDLKDEALQEKAILDGSWGHKNREGKNFCSWLKECFGNYHELDFELMRKLKEYWWGKKEEEESSEDSWSNYSPKNDNDAIQVDQEQFDIHETMQDDDDHIMDLEDYLI